MLGRNASFWLSLLCAPVRPVRTACTDSDAEGRQQAHSYQCSSKACSLWCAAFDSTGACRGNRFMVLNSYPVAVGFC